MIISDFIVTNLTQNHSEQYSKVIITLTCSNIHYSDDNNNNYTYNSKNNDVIKSMGHEWHQCLPIS